MTFYPKSMHLFTKIFQKRYIELSIFQVVPIGPLHLSRTLGVISGHLLAENVEDNVLLNGSDQSSKNISFANLFL